MYVAILRDAAKRPLLRMRAENFAPTTPSKLRRTFFRKRFDAFLDLVAAHAFAMAAVGRVDLLGGQEQFLGVINPEACDIARDAALVIVQAETRRRHEHFASVDADAEVAGPRQIGRAAIDAAVEPADC